MNDIMNITPVEGTVTYTYDELDRVYLRNVYKDDTVQRARYPGVPNYSFQGLTIGGPQKPKELIYQDVHYYNTNIGGVSYIKRIYKPTLTTPVSSNVNGTITATVSSQSHIIAAGIHYNANETEFCFRVIQPFLLTQLGSYWYHTTNIPLLSTVTLTNAGAGPGYYKAFAVTETGTLFSKTLIAS